MKNVVTKSAREKFNEDLESFEVCKEIWIPFKENETQDFDDDYALYGFKLTGENKFVFFVHENDYDLSKIEINGKTEYELLLENWQNLDVKDESYDHKKVFDFILDPGKTEVPLSAWEMVRLDIIKNDERAKSVTDYDDDTIEIETDDIADYCWDMIQEIGKDLRAKSFDDIYNFKKDGFEVICKTTGLDKFQYIEAKYKGVGIVIQDSEYGIYIGNCVNVETYEDGEQVIILDEENCKELLTLPSPFTLTERQREYVEKFEKLVKEMKEENIGFILDECGCDIYFLNLEQANGIESVFHRDKPSGNYTEIVPDYSLYKGPAFFDVATYLNDDDIYAQMKK